MIRFVQAHQDTFGVAPLLRVLEIPSSTYYGWLEQQRYPSARQYYDAWLSERIEAIHDRSGAPTDLRGCMPSWPVRPAHRA